VKEKSKKQVLVTGGLGFIGSHTVVLLQQKGYEVIIIDDLSNSNKDVLEGIKSITGIQPALHVLDLKNKEGIKGFFLDYPRLKNVIHFAASKAVGESVTNPLMYYENNLCSLVYLLQELNKKKKSNFIFSSSCTVYGEADSLPISEFAPIKMALSPYGNTKQIGEEIIRDFAISNIGFHSILLRYFNPIGAHPSGLIGELPNGVPQNLVPFVTQTAIGLRDELLVYGGDYATHDGSGIRDYIHVMDLADAHIIALERLLRKRNLASVETFNIGTGAGTSVLEIIKTFIAETGVQVPYRIVDRRTGDITAAFADTERASVLLNWKAKRTLAESLKDAWNWEQKVRKKIRKTN
jgi:UDP-glucose 4-epimerase